MSGQAATSTGGDSSADSAGNIGAAAASGAAMGSIAGPWGMAAGAVIGVGGSLIQAGEQAAAVRSFQAQQDKAAAEAKRQAGANFMKNVGVPVSGELEGMRANTAAYKQALEAGAEGDYRILPGIVGRINESNVGANAQQSVRMDDKLYALHMAQAKEMKQSSNALAGISLEEAEGAGLAKQQAEKAKIAAYTNAAQAGLRIGAGLDQMQDLYKRQNTPSTQSVYNTETDPMLANINKYNTPEQPILGPQIDTRGFSPIEERYSGIPQIDWSLF